MLNYYPSDVIHVKESAGGKQDGTSWEDAYTDLQDGLDEAARRVLLQGAEEVQVLVAQGKYRPRRSHGLKGNSRTFNFTLYNGVSIKGGFCGTDAYIQDLENYPSIMTGDLGPYRTYHVLYVAEGRDLDLTAYMENMVIEGGQANGMNKSAPESFGGGLYVERGNQPLIVSCIFRNNEAVSGGGACFMTVSTQDLEGFINRDGLTFLNRNGDIYIPRGPVYTDNLPLLYMCRFENNKAYKTGGGISVYNVEFDYENVFHNIILRYNTADYGGGISFINCKTSAPGHESPGYPWNYPLLIFENNKAVRGGGGMYVRGDMKSVFTRLLFKENTSEEYGGGILISGGDVSLRNIVLVGNGSVIGGGLYLIAGRYVLRSLMFVKNKAAQTAGALYTVSTKTTADRCYFRNNSTEGLSYPDQIGGAIVANKGLLIVTNTIFLDNKSKRGGGIYGQASDLRLTCNTYLNNKAETGPVIYNDKGLLTVRSSIIRRPEGSSENRPIWGDMRISYVTADPKTILHNANNVTDTDPDFDIVEGALPYVPEENCNLFFPEGLVSLPRGSNAYLNGNLFDFIATPRPSFVLNGYLESGFYSLICLLSDEEDTILEDADGFLLEDFCPEYEDYD